MKRALAISPDGTMIASGGDSVHLWDALSGKELRQWNGQANALAFAPDGKKIVAVMDIRVSPRMTRSALHCFDVISGEQAWELGGTFNDAIYSPDGSQIALPELECVWIISATSGKQLHRIRYGNHHVWAAAFTPDGQKLATGGDDNRIRLWRTSDWNEINPGSGHEGPVQVVSFSPDGHLIASGGLDGTIRFWSWPGGKEMRRIEGVGSSWGVQNLVFSPRGTRLASFGHINGGNHVCVWDIRTGAQLAHFGKESAEQGLAFSEDEAHLFTGMYNGSIGVWDVTNGTLLRTLGAIRGALYDLKLLPGGDRAFWIGEYQGLGVRDLATGGDVLFKSAHHHSGGHLAAAPDGSWLAVDYRVWNTASGQVHWEKNYSDNCGAVVISSDSRLMACARPEGITLWEHLTRAEIHTLPVNEGTIHSLAFSPDGEFLASAGHDGTVLVWNVPGIHTGAGAPLNRRQFETLWRELGSTNHWAAFTAMWRFAKAGASGVEFLRENLKLARALSESELAQLRAKFNHTSFDIREPAARTLVDHGIELEPAQWNALRRPPPESHLWSSAGPRIPLPREAYLPPPQLQPLAERLRSSRAVLALQHSSSISADAVLVALAEGFGTDPQTVEAKQALEWRRKQKSR